MKEFKPNPRSETMPEGKKAILGTLRDITERGKIDAKLKESIRGASEMLEFNELILNTTSIGIVTYESSGKCTFANKAAARMLGTDIAGLMALNFHKIESWKKSGMHEVALKALRSNSEQKIDVHIRTSFGKDVWLKTRFSHFLVKGEKQLLLFISDISDDKKNQEALRTSEEQYRSLVESAADQIFMVDRNNRIISANKRMAVPLGRPPAEVIGKRLSEIFPEETASRLSRNSKYVFRHGMGISTEERMVAANGREFYINTFLNSVRDSKGKITAVVGTVRDITRIKTAEESMRASEEHYRSLFNNAPVALLEADFSEVKKCLDRVRGRSVFDFKEHLAKHSKELAACTKKLGILDVNLAALRVFESKSKESVRNRLKNFLSGELFGTFTEMALYLLMKRKTARAEIAVKTVGGKPFNAVVEASLLPGYEGSWKRILLSVTDITELGKAEKTIKLMDEDLERLSDATVEMELEVVELRRRIKKLEAEKTG